jgi:hypothetical protein
MYFTILYCTILQLVVEIRKGRLKDAFISYNAHEDTHRPDDGGSKYL